VDDIIDVGGNKVNPAEVEEAAYKLPEVCHVKASGELDPFLGQHISLSVQIAEGESITKREFRAKLSQLLDREKLPHRITFEEIPITLRFKKR